MDDPHIPFLPCSENAVGGAAHIEAPVVLSGERAAVTIAYVRSGLTLEAFIAYVESYDFGPVPPSQIILHNTANPAASWAPALNVPNWDRDEDGLTEPQIKAKRLKQLDAIYIGYYQNQKGWPAGPQLLIDDMYVWLGTPMDTIGIHAGAGNSYRINGRLRYSIGVEIVGRYALTRWPAPIISMLRGAVGALSKRLGIQIAYTAAPVGQPARHDGQIAFHRDYTTEKDCPGRAIDPAWAISVLGATPAPVDPLRAATIPGVDGQTFHCSVRTRDFYAGHGGQALFGLARANETRAVGLDKRPCSYVPCERVVIKTAAEGPHLALIEEFQAKEWA